MVEQGASVYGVLLSLQKIDQIGHHGNLVAFDFLQGGDRFLALSVMRKSVIAAVESKVPVGETAHAGNGPGGIGLEGEGDDFDHGLELLGCAVARFGFIDRGFGLGPIDPGFCCWIFPSKVRTESKYSSSFCWSCLPSCRLRDLAWSITRPKYYCDV